MTASLVAFTVSNEERTQFQKKQRGELETAHHIRAGVV
jgi:hypothetical protein